LTAYFGKKLHLSQMGKLNDVLEIRNKKSKKFKILNEKGLKFEKNMISPKNQLESQPHYFNQEI
jgi:hypothetical protein